MNDLPGIICIADDIIIHGKNDEEHDINMKKFLQRCETEGIALNKKKMQIKVEKLTFMGHMISKNGLSPDPAKVEAIKNARVPNDKTQLRSFLGAVNYLGKFMPNLSNEMQPLNNLLKNDVQWIWSSTQDKAFKTVKDKISDSTMLSYYDSRKGLTLENDASEYGIGSVLLQENKPIGFASRTLTPTEQNYAQIEKEMLAIVYGLEKFHYYAYGKRITVVTDHQPLVTIKMKPLSKAPKRLRNMLLRCQDYDMNLIYKPGTSIPVADALSRNPSTNENTQTVHFVSNIENLPVNKYRFNEIQAATDTDSTLKILKETIAHGWPDKKELHPSIVPYFSYRDEMTCEDGIIMRGDRIVIPKSLRYDMKQKIHSGHTGINSCLRRARTYVFWPGMSAEIRSFIETCETCTSLPSKQPQQSLFPHKVPDRPWQSVSTDIFCIESRNYLVTVDNYSNFFEVDFLQDMTSNNIISKLKQHFARHGIPDTIYSDNGPQLVSTEFHNFCIKWNVTHNTSSPGNSKANGSAEAAVKVAKNLMKKCQMSKEDPYIALLNLRNTPQEGIDATPAQRLFGRRTRTLLPTKTSLR